MAFEPTATILSAGPSISQKEIDYVMDAVKNGWNEKLSEYIDRFEKAFAEYIGAKYAWSTSSGTAALHLSLLGCGIGEGDEVIIPELTFAACPNTVSYTGAKPVFADIDPTTWCIDQNSVLKNITPRTKAIMPVHMYGNLANVEAILEISKKYNLFVVEDACPAVGIRYKGKHAGTFGNTGAFSFHGAKIAAIGQGGMFTTNDSEIYNRAHWLGTHGADWSTRKFLHTAVGYKYYMSNIQAALGLAQLERIEEFVEAKSRIFKWYQERLRGIEGLAMNEPGEGVRSNYWMSSMVLHRDFGITRDELIEKLKEKKIDTRPFFVPMSDFPHFETADNPVAREIALNGINLPSGVELSEEKVDYIARMVREVLGKNLFRNAKSLKKTIHEGVSMR